MARFTGLTDMQWELLERLIPIRQYVRGRGHPPASPRYVLNSIYWILITGARWCDLPKGPQWGSRTASHRWMGIWQETGILEKLLTALQEIANIAKMIDFDRLAVDGFFSAGKGGGEDVEHGYKGKGVTSHVITDGQGNPMRITSTSAAGDERLQVTPLLKKNHSLDKASYQCRQDSDIGSRQRVRRKRSEGSRFSAEDISNDSIQTGREKTKDRDQIS